VELKTIKSRIGWSRAGNEISWEFTLLGGIFNYILVQKITVNGTK